MKLRPLGSSAIAVLALLILASPGFAGLELIAQSPQEVTLRYEMDDFTIVPLTIGGETYQKIELPGVFLPNDAGAPDLPGIGRFLAVPNGARASVEIISSETETLRDLRISPAPVIPKETDDGPLVYNENTAIFERDAYYPASPVLLSGERAIRGVGAVVLGLTPFQYNPVRGDLLVYREITLRVRFDGGSGAFGDARLRSRYWEPILRQHFMNYASLPETDYNRGLRDRNGFEYIIITPDQPDFIAWADTLKAWRKLEGITTEVFTTAEIGGTTVAAIEGFLNNAYNTWDPAPSAFLILGDYPGTGFDRDSGITSPIWDSYCASDNIFADVDNDDLPDMIHARITARDAAELARMINKGLDYERHPETDPAYYDQPILAGGWQTERWFILCTEVLYGHLSNVLGKNPIREYAIYSGTPGNVWSTNQNTPTVVNYFGPSGLGYIPATPQHLTDWGGNATRINADINAGSFMLMHRDHGYESGWGEPAYDTANLSGLHNEKLPFVFSMNCLTGKYNWASQSFTEAFHRMEAGALGLIAASEVSYSFVNDTMIWGLWDTMWPGFMPDYGPYPPDTPWATDLKTAFGMASGKYFLESSSWPYNQGDKEVTYHLFHHHGDAFLTLYSQVPRANDVTHDSVCFLGNPVFQVRAELGSSVALTVDGEIVGRAAGTGFAMDIPIVPPAAPGELRVTVTKPNCYRYDARVPIIPPSGPYLVCDGVGVLDAPGDQDGTLDAGESPAIEVFIENVGIEPTTGVIARIATEDPHVEILAGEAPYPDIPAGGRSSGLTPFAVRVHGTVPDRHMIPFTVEITAVEGTWDGQFVLEAHAPVLVGQACVVNDDVPLGDADGVLDPGESFYLQAGAKNAGRGSSGQLAVVLSAGSPYLVVEDGEGECPELGPDASSLAGTFQLRLLPDCPNPAVIPIQAVFTAPSGFAATLEYEISVGAWTDDAESDRGWSLSAAGDNATSGQWVRAEPVGTTYNGQQAQTETDHTPDPSSLCFITGNGSVGGAAGEADVDGGKTTLMTPAFDLSHAVAASISYWRWYTNNLGNSPGLDTWTVEATSDGTNWVALEHTLESANSWTQHSFDLASLLPLTEAVRIRFIAEDIAPGSLIEAAVDDFALDASFEVPSSAEGGVAAGGTALLACSPNPSAGDMLVRIRLARSGDVDLGLFDVAGRRVADLRKGAMSAGIHEVSWHGDAAASRALPSGIYFLRLKTADHLAIRQVTVIAR